MHSFGSIPQLPWCFGPADCSYSENVREDVITDREIQNNVNMLYHCHALGREIGTFTLHDLYWDMLLDKVWFLASFP